MNAPAYRWAIFTSNSPLYSGVWEKDRYTGQWDKQDQANYTNITDIVADASGDGWIVGTNGTLIHIVGGNLTIAPSLTQYNLTAVSMLSPDDAWVVGDYGTILHYHHGTWDVVSIQQ